MVPWAVTVTVCSPASMAGAAAGASMAIPLAMAMGRKGCMALLLVFTSTATNR